MEKSGRYLLFTQVVKFSITNNKINHYFMPPDVIHGKTYITCIIKMFYLNLIMSKHQINANWNIMPTTV